VIAAVLVIFMVVAMASAFGQQWRKEIHGEYAFTGTGQCLFAPGGFDEKFVPKTNLWWFGPNWWDGVITFNKNGSGSLDARHRYMDNAPTVDAGLAHIYWGFTYTVDRGKIIFTVIPGTYLVEYLEGPSAPGTVSGVLFDHPYDGYISADGKNLIVSYGVPMKGLAGPPCSTNPQQCFESVCSGVFQGFRTDWKE
jgi:hypothetical protein